MSNITQQLNAEKRRQKFSELLREMFQLNQPELDFGLYRIMHARKDDINRFIERDLPNITKDAFKGFATQDRSHIEQELEKAVQGARALEIDPDSLQKVRDLKEKLSDNFDLAREEGEVYDALVTFFNRYYDEGDFLSRRVYKDGTYAIPYQGEEVVLHWANKDQYYIKSSETLRDYTFRLNPNASIGEDPLRVHFKLVDAEAGAKDNNKEGDDSKRVFILDTETPFELIDSESNDRDSQGNIFKELQLCFHFRAATDSDWSEEVKVKASAAAQKKAPTQDHLRAITVNYLLSAESGLPVEWQSALKQPYRKADGELAEYSILQGQLNNYTKKNSFDYFIHKDLGGFLSRELDFYIKNELLDWTDIASLKNDTTRLAPLLSKIEVIRTLGEKIIAFLAQLENFQKKLWLKKKFVTETNYCVTLDRLVDYEDLLTQVFENEAQLADWERLYALDMDKLEEDYETLEWSEFLAFPKYRYLMLDTAHFDSDFKTLLAAKIDDFDEQTDGLLIHSENFQALNFLQNRYREKVKCIYIDPPYNTGSDGFCYKDSYKASSWLTMINDRLALAKNCLRSTGVVFTSINKIERDSLISALNSSFGKNNRVEELIWAQDTVSNNAPNYSTNHEYIEVYAKNIALLEEQKEMFREVRPGYREVTELIEESNKKFESLEIIEKKIKELYKERKAQHIAKELERGLTKEEAAKTDPWKGIYPYTNVEYRNLDGRLIDEHLAEQESATPWVWRKVEPSMPSGKQSSTTKDPNSDNYRYYSPLNPYNGEVCKAPKRGWAFPEKKVGDRPSFEGYVKDNRIWFGDGVTPQQKYFLHEVGSVVATSVLRQYADGEPQLEKLFGRKGLIQNPKPPALMGRLINQTCNNNDVVMDFFAGSGSTGHAVLNHLRVSGDKLKYVLVEMGEHFDAALRSRIAKCVYSSSWSAGEPTHSISESLDGLSHFFKYIRLESYEDALGNLALNRQKGQQALLESGESSSLNRARQNYVMNYMLEVETRGSQSLLNTQQFLDPTRYELKVRSASGDETKSVCVDLLETFNYLLGLRVEHIAAPIYFDAELSQGEFGRWQAKVKQKAEGDWWFRTVYGTNANGQNVLVVWRNLPSVIAGHEHGMHWDNAVLDAVLIEKLAIRLTESQDDEIDILYVNGDHNIAIPRDRKGELMEQARLQLIEEAFHRLMFAGTDSLQ